MVFLGFGKYARADKIYALEPITGDERGGGRRTRVWVEGIPEPLVASRTERTILHDMGHEAGDSALLDGALDLAMELGATVLAAAPLAEGQIGDRPGLAASVTARATIRALDAVAGRQGVGRAAVAAAFVAGHGARPVPLFGTQEPTELRAAPEMFRVRLEREDWYRILEAAETER